MVRLAKFLSWCFAAAALIFAWTFLTNLRYIPHFVHLGAFHGREAAVTAWLLLLPPVLVLVYGMAWWTTHKGAAHARGWAIAASVVNILFALSPLLFLSRIPPGNVAYVLLAGPELLVLAFGVGGLVVFSRRDVLPQMATPTHPSPRRAGDGTSSLVDTVVQLVGIGAVLAGLIWMGRWGESRGLPQNVGLWFWIELLIADLVVVFVHELGHASVGLALGMRLRAFTVGPFQWQIREGKWAFQFQPANILALTGGSAGLVPTKLTDSDWPELCMIGAGPAASLCLGVMALWATLAAKGRPWEPAWELLGLIALISLVAFAINLVPFRPEADYSDGAHIYQILTHSPWSDVHRAFLAVGSSLVTPLRPRDYDAEGLRRAAALVTSGHQGFLLRMYLFLHLLDCGQTPEALQALAEAETVFEQSASDLPGELLAYFVYANAFLKPDAARARYWWDLMEAKNARHNCTEYWLARTGISWIENQRKEALEAWEQGNALAQKLPQAGAYEFDRSLFLRLRQTLDAACGARS
ncbi:MAG TPA: M50 family metallopeptidase [Patescibacteria group bacterium]|nr:M50 family metallopeptidase [Patescibacteria group bacterium]